MMCRAWMGQCLAPGPAAQRPRTPDRVHLDVPLPGRLWEGSSIQTEGSVIISWHLYSAQDAHGFCDTVD